MASGEYLHCHFGGFSTARRNLIIRIGQPWFQLAFPSLHGVVSPTGLPLRKTHVGIGSAIASQLRAIRGNLSQN
jgi:hypothetical protein